MTSYLEKSSRYIIYICGFLLFLCAFFTGVEVILRKFFLISLGGVDEISSYVLGICISWSIAYVLFEKMHIRIDILYHKLTKKIQYLFDLLAMVSTFIFISIIAYFSFDVFLSSFEKNSLANTPLGTPLWIPQLLWTSGFIFFLIVISILIYKCLQNIFTKNKNDVAIIKKDIL